jgi:hypothetical protein
MLERKAAEGGLFIFHIKRGKALENSARASPPGSC